MNWWSWMFWNFTIFSDSISSRRSCQCSVCLWITICSPNYFRLPPGFSTKGLSFRNWLRNCWLFLMKTTLKCSKRWRKTSGTSPKPSMSLKYGYPTSQSLKTKKPSINAFRNSSLFAKFWQWVASLPKIKRSSFLNLWLKMKTESTSTRLKSTPSART